MDATAILFAAFIFLMLLNVPIALCLGISAIVGIIMAVLIRIRIKKAN